MYAFNESTMRYTAVISFLVLFSALSPASAQGEITFDSYTQNVEFSEENSFHRVEVFFSILNDTKTLDFPTPPRLENLRVVIDGDEKTCTTEEREGFTLVECTFPEGIGGEHFALLTFETNYPLFRIQDRILYKSEYTWLSPTTQFDYFLTLPKGYIIPEEKNASFFINPQPDRVFSDGQRIILSWNRADLKGDFELSVLTESVSKSSLPALGLVIWILALSIGAYLAALAYKRYRKTEVSYPALVDHEKVVVDILKKADGNVLWQKQIQHKSGFKKVKLSRVLRSLEERGVVKKEPVGNTNKIQLITGEEADVSEYDFGEALGESLLVEYSPTAKRSDVLVSMVRFMLGKGKNAVLVSTQPTTSRYRQHFKGLQGIRIINLPDQATMPDEDEIPMTNLEYFNEVFEHLTKDHVFVFEPLSPLILHIGVDHAYRFISQAQNRLLTIGTSFIVFMNREGHEKKDMANFENIFSKIAVLDDSELKKLR